MRNNRSEQRRRENRGERIDELTARLDALSLEQTKLRQEIYSLRREESAGKASTRLGDRNNKILHIGDIVFVITESSRTVRFHGVEKAVVTGVTKNNKRVLLACFSDPTNTSNREPHNVRLWTERDEERLRRNNA